MGKGLKDMSLEELWELFPVILSPYNPQWKEWAMEEMEMLSGKLVSFHPVISHIGSTAIPGIHAKPIVDLLVEVSPTLRRGSIKSILEQECGYICMAESPCRMSFNKGYTVNGFAERVFHLHIHPYHLRCKLLAYILLYHFFLLLQVLLYVCILVFRLLLFL